MCMGGFRYWRALLTQRRRTAGSTCDCRFCFECLEKYVSSYRGGPPSLKALLAYSLGLTTVRPRENNPPAMQPRPDYFGIMRRHHRRLVDCELVDLMARHHIVGPMREPGGAAARDREAERR